MRYREVAGKLRKLGCEELPRRSGGSVPALQECHIQAESVEELLPRIREAVELCIEAEAEEIRARVRMAGHKIMVQKAKDNEVWRAHALAQAEMEKRESPPVPMKL